MKIAGIVSLLYLGLTLMSGCSKADDPTTGDPVETPDPSKPVEPETQKDIQTVDNLILNFIKKYNIPGASPAVSKNSKMVYQKGYGS